MLTILGYIIVGVIGGAIAKWIMPGEQGGGFFKTMFLGIFGALLGGFIGGALFDVSYSNIFSLSGLLFSIGGALLILVIFGFFQRRRAASPAQG